jgi:hypothetical protein
VSLKIPPRILKASEAGHTESYIVCPAIVVGPSTGPVPTTSLFFFFITQFILAFKKPTYIGAGENVFYVVRAHFNPLFARETFSSSRYIIP